MVRKIMRLFLYTILVSFILIGTLKLLLSYSGLLFKLETMGLLFLSFVSLLGLTSSHRVMGRMILFSVGLFSFMNTVLLHVFANEMPFVLIGTSLLLLLFASFLREKHDVTTVDEPLDHCQVFDVEQSKETKKASTKKTAAKKTVTKKKVTKKKVSKKKSN